MMSGQCLGMAEGRAGKSLRTGCLAAVVGVVAVCAGGYALAAATGAGVTAGVQDGRVRSVSPPPPVVVERRALPEIALGGTVVLRGSRSLSSNIGQPAPGLGGEGYGS